MVRKNNEVVIFSHYLERLDSPDEFIRCYLIKSKHDLTLEYDIPIHVHFWHSTSEKKSSNQVQPFKIELALRKVLELTVSEWVNVNRARLSREWTNTETISISSRVCFQSVAIYFQLMPKQHGEIIKVPCPAFRVD